MTEVEIWKRLSEVFGAVEAVMRHNAITHGRQDAIICALAELVKTHPNKEVFESRLRAALSALPAMDGNPLAEDSVEAQGRTFAVAQILGLQEG